MNTPDHLRKRELFDQLTEEELKRFMEKFHEESFKEGTFVFKENDVGSTLYVVVIGTVSMKKYITGDVEKKLFIAQEGLIFGEFSFLDGGIRSASAFTEEDTVLLCLERSDFDNFILDNPAAGSKLYKNLINIIVKRLRRTNEAYRDAIRWGLDLTGTPALNFHYLITEDVDVHIELTSNRTIEGKVLQLETSDAGYQLIMIDGNGNPVIIPYHAVVSVTVAQ